MSTFSHNLKAQADYELPKGVEEKTAIVVERTDGKQFTVSGRDYIAHMRRGFKYVGKAEAVTTKVKTEVKKVVAKVTKK